MDGVTLALHLSLIRLGKGMISAYEKWVRTKARMSGLDPGRPVVGMDEFLEQQLPESERRKADTAASSSRNHLPELVTGLASGPHPSSHLRTSGGGRRDEPNPR
jgi:hypothetical protein